jgi:hypothetical protein
MAGLRIGREGYSVAEATVEAPAEEPSTPEASPTTEEDFGTPEWIVTALQTSETEATEVQPTADRPDEPDWLAVEEQATEEPTFVSQTEPDTPDWLRDDSEVPPEVGEDEPEVPVWLADTVEAETTAESLPPAPDWMMGLREATEAVKAALPPEEAEVLAEDSVAETEEAVLEPAEITSPETDLPWLEGDTGETPDWLQDLDDIPDSPVTPVDEGEPFALPPTIASVKPDKVEDVQKQAPAWLEALRPTEAKMDVVDTPNEAAESTGVLTGLSSWLPAERLATPEATPFAEGQPDAIYEAARRFHAIATQVPQPATLPKPVTRPGQLLGRLTRTGLYLLFIILVALPLLPGLRASDSGRGLAWTEPGGELSEVLDKQRRQMISEELGVIDLQQPESVALVSFDFTPATQGEMQPLAEAIVGRLRGQGMRLIFISLEPEGATLAQQMVTKILAEQGETYGQSIINLGYLPGQVAGLRQLVTSETALSSLPDFQDGLTFASGDQPAWADVQKLGQVDIIVTLADNPVTARWWVEQLALASPNPDDEQFLLAATSATASPFLQPYRNSNQLDGLISGINGAAAVEATRREFGLARQMLDSQSLAHLLIIILIAVATVIGWMPPLITTEPESAEEENLPAPASDNEENK